MTSKNVNGNNATSQSPAEKDPQQHTSCSRQENLQKPSPLRPRQSSPLRPRQSSPLRHRQSLPLHRQPSPPLRHRHQQPGDGDENRNNAICQLQCPLTNFGEGGSSLLSSTNAEEEPNKIRESSGAKKLGALYKKSSQQSHVRQVPKLVHSNVGLHHQVKEHTKDGGLKSPKAAWPGQGGQLMYPSAAPSLLMDQYDASGNTGYLEDGAYKQVSCKKYGPRPELTPKQESQLNEAFGSFDPRGGGIIHIRGFTIGMRALSYEPTDDEVESIIAEVLGDRHDDTIDFKDFYSLMKAKMLKDYRNFCDEDVEKDFKFFCDENRNITFENLKKVADELGENVPEEVIREMINFADKKEVKNGLVNFQEFKNILQRPELE